MIDLYPMLLLKFGAHRTAHFEVTVVLLLGLGLDSLGCRSLLGKLSWNHWGNILQSTIALSAGKLNLSEMPPQ